MTTVAEREGTNTAEVALTRVSLAGLTDLLINRDEFGALCRAIAAADGSNARVVVSGPTAATRPYFVAALQKCLGRPIVVVTARPAQARALADQTAAYSPHPDAVLSWPTPDSLPYERLDQGAEIGAGRLKTLATLTLAASNNVPLPYPREKLVVVASAKALMQPTMSPPDFRDSVRMYAKGQRFDLNRGLAHLVRLGYQPEATVETPGTFSRRGGIVDVWSPLDDRPIRVDLFDDEIDSLRYFDPVSQRSETAAERLIIVPPTELALWRADAAYAALSTLKTDHLRREVQEEWRRILEQIGAAEQFEGMHGFLPYFKDPDEPNLCSLLDHLPPDAIVVLDNPQQITFAVTEMTAQAEELRAEFEAQGEQPEGVVRPYLDWDELSEALARRVCLDLGGEEGISSQRRRDTEGGEERDTKGGNEENPSTMLRAGLAGRRGEGARDINEDGEKDSGGGSLEIFAPAPIFAGQIDRMVADVAALLRDGRRVVVVSQQAERLRDMFAERDVFPAVRIGSKAKGANPDVARLDVMPNAGTLHLLPGALAEGWVSDTLGVVVLTDGEVFGRTKRERALERAEGSRRSQSQRDAFLRDLKSGDYVVHIEHGVAQFAGMINMTTEVGEYPNIEKIRREYLMLRYAGADKLYVPVEQVDRVLPYTAPGEVAPTLNKLGSDSWARTKRKVQQAVEDMARELIALYAQRQATKGHQYPPDTVWQRELEESFPYLETPDQQRAIDDVKTDMESGRLMDRLICGDVGYGKTEVALRAAFKAVMDGLQVAVLVPTTVLAQQHLQTFSRRLQAFPTRVEVLSRFKTKKEQAEIIKAMAAGEVDIVVGTHRLLQKDVQFKRLGMLIIDEEQRFGVKHKERLKQLRTEVDVLTLTATPIPRTLHMGMIGVRDMSVIQTPPEARLPVKTYVTAYTEQLVKEAIMREMDRGGQVYYVHNRVQGIEHIVARLKELLPNARIGMGHGQMDADELEKVMSAFGEGQYDVLVCTTIIESGLDIPNANTLIVDNASMYGLSQLYQIRGRVGRGANRAYAYFLYASNKAMNEDAQKRLETLLELQELGAGFKIALKDLEIRGAGNLLGGEQSGHIASVGFELYVRLLEEAVQDAKGEAESRPIEAQVDAPTVTMALPLHAYLPEDYISDEALRLDIYRRLGRPLNSPAQVRDIVTELEDRFGALPEPVNNLIYLLDLKVLAIRAGLEGIVDQEGEIVLRFRADAAPQAPAPEPRPTSNSSAVGTTNRVAVVPRTEPKSVQRAREGTDALLVGTPAPRQPKRSNVDIRTLLRTYGDALRLSPTQLRFNRKLYPDNWREKLKEIVTELAGGA